MEHKKITVSTKDENIVHLIREYLESFEWLTHQKNIVIQFKSRVKSFKVKVDAEQIRKIMDNLLSNAFKYTENEGKITVSVYPGKSKIDEQLLKKGPGIKTKIQHGIYIKVSDSGIGISPQHLPHIFERFSQVSETNYVHLERSGIGLAFTKKLIEFIHGNITVKSTLNKGTTFTVFIPISNPKPYSKGKTFENTIIKEEKAPDKIREHEPESAELLQENLYGIKTSKPIVLLVEHNPDMVNYVASFLEKEYMILRAKDGIEGMAKTPQYIPDLIVSDVMMPEMDGKEMTKNLKTNQLTKHIPGIMLTGRSAVENRMEGLETGADNYITKPFNARELVTCVKNLINQRQIVRELFEKEMITGSAFAKRGSLPSIDQQFMQKALDIINENYMESDFDVLQFSNKMNLSSAQLHRKLKALTNKSIGKFILAIRLNKAAELLRNKTDNITNIAYETGFINLSWFAKMFKLQFGVVPSKYADSINK